MSVLLLALCSGGAIWLSAVWLKKSIADFKKGSPLPCKDIGCASGLAAFGCLMLIGLLDLSDNINIDLGIYLPSWMEDSLELGLIMVFVILPVGIGFAAYLISKAYVAAKTHCDQIVEIRANRKKLKNIANISRKVDQESRAISEKITRLKEIRALKIKEKSLIPNVRLISLLDAATDGNEPSLKECRSAVLKRRQLLQEEKSIEADIQELALRYRTIGDVDKCAYCLGYVTEAVDFDKESALREIKSQQEKAEHLKMLGQRYFRMAVVLIATLVTVIGAVEGYNCFRYRQAVHAYNNQHYSESMKNLSSIIGPYWGKRALMTRNRTQIGWVYYISDETLYVVSEDGNYTKRVDYDVHTYRSAVDKNYLYYLKDDGIAFVLDMATNKKKKLSIADEIQCFRQKDGILYAEGRIWDSSGRWYFNDEGKLVSNYFYRLDGVQVFRTPDDDEGYTNPEEIKTENLSPWQIKIWAQDNSRGLKFTNLQTNESRFIAVDEIREIVGYYKF